MESTRSTTLNRHNHHKNFRLRKLLQPDIIDEKDTAMTQNLPAEVLKIAPEMLEVANCYLQLNDPRQVAAELDLPIETVTEYLKRREV